jgi:hypothetical protein
VELHRDERLRYLRSEEPLAMSENWERALREASGEYVTVLGDDDALLLHALPDAEQLVRATNTKALRWAPAYYRWPDVSAELGSNLFGIPLTAGSAWQVSAELIPLVVNGAKHYAELPTIYNSFVHRDILASIRKRNGRVIASMTPDIYSGFAVAAEVGTFVSSQRPMSIAGVSASSNGEAMMRKAGHADVARDFEDLNEQFGFRWHSRAPFAPRSLPAVIVEAFEQARERFQGLEHIKIDRKRLIQRVIAERAQSASTDSDAIAKAIQGVREWIRGDGVLSSWFDKHLELLKTRRAAPHETFTVPTKGLHGCLLVLDASEFEVRDTLAAVHLFEKLTSSTKSSTPPPRLVASTWKDAVIPILPPILLRSAVALAARLRENLS